MNCIPEEYLR